MFCLDSGDEETMETTMSTETKQFLRKTKELSKLVSAMKELEVSCEQELHEIEKKLTDLSIAVEKDKCLNAGGKFEWVDSMLVKVSSSFLFYFSLFTHCLTMIFRHQSTENCVRFIFYSHIRILSLCLFHFVFQ